MAGSRFAYVRSFELPDPVLPSVFMVVRVDGKGFHGFSEAHDFVKPNDAVALELMNHSARHVCQELRGDVTMAFGESDEFSFLLKKSCKLYNRRESKIVTHIVSLFTSAYVFYWSEYFPNKRLRYPPSFDGRLVAYPGVQEVKDYFAWRQADTHINNLYNTTFWALVLQGGQTEREAHETLKGTISSQKNEILFSRFGINYERLPAMFRKGTTIVWTESEDVDVDDVEGEAEGEMEREGDSGMVGQDQDKGDVPSGSSLSGMRGDDAHEKQGEAMKTSPLQPARSRNVERQRQRQRQRQRRKAPPRVLRTLHVDIIGKSFWNASDEGHARQLPTGDSSSSSSTTTTTTIVQGQKQKHQHQHKQKQQHKRQSENIHDHNTDTDDPESEAHQDTDPPWERLERLQRTSTDGLGLGLGLGRWALQS